MLAAGARRLALPVARGRGEEVNARDWTFLAGAAFYAAFDLLATFVKAFVEQGRKHRVRCAAHDRKAVVWYYLTLDGRRHRAGSCEIAGCIEAAMADLRRLAGVA